MTLLVLTARPGLATNRRLAEAASHLGSKCVTLDATRAMVVNDSKGPKLMVGALNHIDPRPAAAIARIGNWRPDTLLAALEATTAAGVFSPNSAAAMRIARDHWQTIFNLQLAGLPVPKSVVGMDPDLTARVASDQLGLPVVVKLRRSRMGIGVMLCRTLDHLQSILDSLWRLGDEFLIQEYVAAGGISTRALVVGGQIVAGARFKSIGAEWRSNSALGGTAAPAVLQPDERTAAAAAAATLGLGVCAVDLLAGPDGPLICEVNPTPGFIKLEATTGIDVAAAIVGFALEGGRAPRD